VRRTQTRAIATIVGAACVFVAANDARAQIYDGWDVGSARPAAGWPQVAYDTSPATPSSHRSPTRPAPGYSSNAANRRNHDVVILAPGEGAAAEERAAAAARGARYAWSASRGRFVPYGATAAAEGAGAGAAGEVAAGEAVAGEAAMGEAAAAEELLLLAF